MIRDRVARTTKVDGDLMRIGFVMAMQLKNIIS